MQMTNFIEELSNSWDEASVCEIEYPDGRTFFTAGYSWFECGWNAVLDTRARSRKMGTDHVLREDEILTLRVAPYRSHKAEVRVRDVISWARLTGLYSELSS